MRYFKFTMLSICFFLFATVKSWGETLRYAVFSAPPFMILGGDEDIHPEYSGIDIEIVHEIARRMNLDVTIVRCPWVRCLRLLKDGQADMLTSVYKKPDREEFLEYFHKPYLESLQIAFYFKNGKNLSIDKYEDLYGINSIGVLRNALYFDRFDQDKDLHKHESTTQDMLFPMLISGRFDLMVGYVPTENYRLVVEGYSGLVRKSNYEFAGKDPVFMALSKKSPLIGRMNEFNRTNNELMHDGYIKKTIEYYYGKYQP